MTEFYSPLNTWVCQSVRGDPHSSSPPAVFNLPEGKRSEVGQGLAADSSLPCLLPFSLPQLRALSLLLLLYLLVCVQPRGRHKPNEGLPLGDTL